ncbi:MAG: phospholipid carrier-dependent glycosyltransferase, partial [Candidatus Woesearchaeota archaeon]
EIIKKLKEKKCTIAELSSETGYDRDTVHNVIRDLRGHGLKKEVVGENKYYSLHEPQAKEKKRKIFHGWAFIALLIAILMLGIFLRVHEVSLIGYWNDDISTLPTALLWFYPHDSYPGLSAQGEPALGNLIIGGGCMLSGEDFSRVTEVMPMFYPGREELIGESLVNASFWCHLPVYIFGIAFFILISLFSLLIIRDKSALFAIAFFAFYPVLLKYSRFTHVDVIEYSFVALALIFLLAFYREGKGTLRELLYCSLAFLGLGLALATKLPTALFFMFGLFLIAEKYFSELLYLLKGAFIALNLKFAERIREEGQKLGLLLKVLLAAGVPFVIVIYMAMEFSFRNLFLVFSKYRESSADIGGFGLNANILEAIRNFLLWINVLDIMLIAAAAYMAYKIIRRKKTLEEKFLLYLAVPFFIVLFFSYASVLDRVFFVFAMPLIFLGAMALSEREGSLLSHLKWRKVLFYSAIIIYIAYSFALAYTASPFFADTGICRLTGSCDSELFHVSEMHVADYLSSHLAEGETFVTPGWSVIYYYIHQDESLPKYYFREQFRQQMGRMPSLLEYAAYFKPFNRTVRYIAIGNNPSSSEEAKEIFDSYAPNDRIYVKGREVALIYDLKGLKKRE